MRGQVSIFNILDWESNAKTGSGLQIQDLNKIYPVIILNLET